MQLKNVLVNDAVGAILVHNVVDAEGRKALSKGKLVRAEDVDKLRALGRQSVYVAALEPGDVREDEAAARLAQMVAGDKIERSKPSGGRVNFYAAESGFLTTNSTNLKRINELSGVTLATIAKFAPVAPKKMIATLKTIGLALPESTLREAEKIGAVMNIAPVRNHKVAIVLTGSENGRARVQEIFAPPLRARVEELGAQVIVEDYVAEEEGAIANAIGAATGAGAQIVMLAGETSIMDASDITPRGIARAGGQIELYGAPVEPGNLLLLAYCGAVPVIGAPGCVKSRETNVVDLILPRLLAGERVSRADVIALADGGLLVG
ncbi:MAG: molybdopterin-binding protein [Chloroflexi bacterium]|nr:molybdopterin-binding protein [Chloroflexota bacterium]